MITNQHLFDARVWIKIYYMYNSFVSSYIYLNLVNDFMDIEWYAITNLSPDDGESEKRHCFLDSPVFFLLLREPNCILTLSPHTDRYKRNTQKIYHVAPLGIVSISKIHL